MIDIHCHIPPQVDDGPSTMSDALLIVQQARAAGVTGMIATPHVIEDISPSQWSNVRQTFTLLKKQVEGLGIDIDLYLGAELLMSPELPKQLMKQARKVNGYLQYNDPACTHFCNMLRIGICGKNSTLHIAREEIMIMTGTIKKYSLRSPI